MSSSGPDSVNAGAHTSRLRIPLLHRHHPAQTVTGTTKFAEESNSRKSPIWRWCETVPSGGTVPRRVGAAGEDDRVTAAVFR
jgi:hypothetical protein